MRVRDYYFAAWAIARGHSYRIDNGLVYLDVDTQTLQNLKNDYAGSDKARFDQVRQIIKNINALRNSSAHADSQLSD